MTTLTGGGSTAATPVNIELTPMRVTWGGTDLGSTSGNAVVSIQTSKAPITADQYGKTDLDMRWNGFKLTVTTELLELRNTTTWSELFPSATFTAGSPSAITFGLPIGKSDLSGSQLLNLHPLVKPDADLTQDHNFYLAYPDEKSSISYGPGGEAKAKIVWNVFPLLTGSGAPKFYKFGSLSVGP